MINKLKYNSKIKIISLLSAMVLWMYVMAIVDPEETKLFENIPVTITNMKEILLFIQNKILQLIYMLLGNYQI